MTVRDDALRDELNGLTPRLRRYARALTTGHAGPSELADDLVHATLMRALGARHIGAVSELVIRLYATVTQLNREVAVSAQQAQAAGAGRPTLMAVGRAFSSVRQTSLSSGLLALPLEAREALLLVGLEGFDHSEAARILRISRSVLMIRLTQARTSLETALPRTAGLTASVTQGGGAQNNARPPSALPKRSAVPHLRLVT